MITFHFHEDLSLQKRRIRVNMLMIQYILIKAMFFSFCESMYLSYFRFRSNAWQDEGVIFFSLTSLTFKKVRFFFYLSFAKKVVPA